MRQALCIHESTIGRLYACRPSSGECPNGAAWANLIIALFQVYVKMQSVTPVEAGNPSTVCTHSWEDKWRPRRSCPDSACSRSAGWSPHQTDRVRLTAQVEPPACLQTSGARRVANLPHPRPSPLPRRSLPRAPWLQKLGGDHPGQSMCRRPGRGPREAASPPADVRRRRSASAPRCEASAVENRRQSLHTAPHCHEFGGAAPYEVLCNGIRGRCSLCEPRPDPKERGNALSTATRAPDPRNEYELVDISAARWRLTALRHGNRCCLAEAVPWTALGHLLGIPSQTSPSLAPCLHDTVR